MIKTLTSLVLAFGLFSSVLLPATALAQATATTTPDAVTVVIQIAPIAGASKDAANSAFKDMVALIKKQPGYLSDDFLQNLNASNTPSHVHVIRFVSLKYWENVFTAPEFAKFSATNSKLFTISASAFKQEK